MKTLRIVLVLLLGCLPMMNCGSDEDVTDETIASAVEGKGDSEIRCLGNSHNTTASGTVNRADACKNVNCSTGECGRFPALSTGAIDYWCCLSNPTEDGNNFQQATDDTEFRDGNNFQQATDDTTFR